MRQNYKDDHLKNIMNYIEKFAISNNKINNINFAIQENNEDETMITLELTVLKDLNCPVSDEMINPVASKEITALYSDDDISEFKKELKPVTNFIARNEY